MRSLLIGLGLGLVLETAVCAEEPGKESAPQPAGVAAPVNPGDLTALRPAGRKRWEALLSQPAELNFSGRKTVRVKEVLDQLRDRHHLSLRVDVPTLSALVGAEAFRPEPSSRPVASTPPNSENRGQDTALLSSAAGSVRLTSAEPAPAAESESDRPPSAPVVVDDALEDAGSENNIFDLYLNLEINVQTIDFKQVTIRTALRHTLDALPITVGTDVLEVPLPISLTNACLLDYLVEEDGLLITTRMTALSRRETQVYSVKHLKETTAEELAKVIRQTVRPWSWRAQINDLGDQLRGSVHLPSGVVQSLVATGVQLAAAEAGATVTTTTNPPPQPEEIKGPSESELLGNAAVNGLVTFAQASLSALEMMHYGELPTATIQTIPGKLIVTQSQAAHREISDLLRQLSDGE